MYNSWILIDFYFLMLDIVFMFYVLGMIDFKDLIN